MADYKKYKVGITPKENWAPDISFEQLDYTLWSVNDGGDGCGYIALKDNIGVLPNSDVTTWRKATEAGQSIYDLAVKYHHFVGTEEEFEAQYQQALSDAISAAQSASAIDTQVRASEQQRVVAEQGRVSAEHTRLTSESARVAAETERQSAENTRVSNEKARVSSESERQTAESARVRETASAITDANTARDQADASATRANTAATNAESKATLANDAATLANTKAQLANDKAALAETAATNANEKASIAQQKATYSETQGDYAKAQGDYAKAQGDYAKAQGDTALADHERAETDHTRADSDHAAVEVYVDSLGVFDLSKHNAVGGVLATYADLSAAITALNALESKYKYGGMSFKFVQSSDNKYVQYRYMGTAVTGNPNPFLDTANWQGVDEELVAGSNNIIESGAVRNSINQVQLDAFGITDNQFSQKSIREGYIVNTDGTIVPPSGTDVFVISGYIPLPEKWTSIVYSGVIASGTIRGRFSSTINDSEEGIKISMSGDGQEHKIAYNANLSDKKYVVLTLFRGVSGSTPDLSNVSIKFLYDNNIVKEVGELSVSVGELSDEVAELHDVIDGRTIVPQFNLGFIKSSDGTLSPGSTTSTYRYSDAIAVIPGSKVNINNVSGSSGVFTVALYQTENGNADLSLSKKGTNQNVSYNDFEVPAGINFIRLGYSTGFLPEGSSCNININGVISELQSSVADLQNQITELQEDIEIEHDTILHTPSVSPRKAAIAFQLDWATLAQNNVLDYASLLAEHGIKKSTYFILPNRATDAYGLDKMLAIQDLGNEIGLHSDTQHDIAPTDPAVTPSDMRTYIADWLSQMYAKGFKNLPGMVCRTAKVQEALIPVINEYFSYRTGVSSGGIDYNAHDTSTFIGCVNSLETDSRCPKRLGIELTTELQTTEDEDIVIANTKTAIDTAIATKGYLVIYGHTYNELSAGYTITERVLNEILDYVLAKIISGDVVVGGTSEILNYYYSKRNYEQ